MQAFGREVAVKTVVTLISTAILAAWGAAWRFAPTIAANYGVAWREGLAWALAGVLTIALALSAFVIAALWPRRPTNPGRVTVVLNGGVKPSITLTHHGDPARYTVDGKLLSLLDGSTNPVPTQFRAHLQVAGVTGEWQPTLSDGQWANVVLGSVEQTTSPWAESAPRYLVVRRGKIGQQVRVPDSGAVVEIYISADPPLEGGRGTLRYALKRDGDVVEIAERPV